MVTGLDALVIMRWQEGEKEGEKEDEKEDEKAGLVSQFQQGDFLSTFEHGRDFGYDLTAFS